MCQKRKLFSRSLKNTDSRKCRNRDTPVPQVQKAWVNVFSSSTKLQQDFVKRTLRAVIYCRVSTDKQDQDGESLEYQEDKCRKYAELHGIEVVMVLHEVKSG